MNHEKYHEFVLEEIKKLRFRIFLLRFNRPWDTKEQTKINSYIIGGQ